MQKTVEIIIPCCNEEQCLPVLANEIDKVFSKIDNCGYRLLFVDDGSTDGTLGYIKSLHAENPKKTNYISFSRNFGKESAIYAGLKNCTGDYIVLMDADMQHPPKLIPDMISEIESGYDCCIACRNSRKNEPALRNILSGFFYKTFRKFASVNVAENESDFRIMTRQMANAIIMLTERERFSKGIMSWVGFRIKRINYENICRANNKTKWSLSKLSRYAETGFTSFSGFPFRIIAYTGLGVIIAAIVLAVVFLLHESGREYTTAMLVLFFSGGILSVLGVIGIYLTKIYSEIKRRPIYIEKESSIKAKGNR